MTRNRYRHNKLQSTIKDYLVPIIGWVLVLILLYSFFSSGGDSENSNPSNDNRTPTEISFWSIDTEAIIVYPGNIKETISESDAFYMWEKIIVKQGNLLLSDPSWNKIHLNKVAELKYEEDGNYSLYSSDAWFTLANDSTISMSYANVSAPAGSIIALTQNEANSTIYVLAGSAKVTNLWGVNTLLIKGQKISVSRLNAASKDVDLAGEKSPIDSYFKWSDWFIENKWHIILQQDSQSWEEDQEDWEETTASGDSGAYISFDKLRDEMSVEGSSLDVSGKILSEEIGSITINNSQVSISEANSSFSLSDISLRNTINDIVVKIYNTNKNILQKKVYTVYTSSQASSSSNAPVSGWSTTYEVDATKFGFTEPSATGKFSTTSGEITIRGFTTAKEISRVEVNGFKLASFNGSTWRYHAFERFETLEEWSNQYRVDYYGAWWSIIYTDYYTIVKKTADTVETSTESTPPSSEQTEATLTPDETIPAETDLFAN